jgi:hypothetical protein
MVYRCKAGEKVMRLLILLILMPVSFLCRGDSVISEDTTWRGKVQIKDKTTVLKKAFLKVAPGTIVSFEGKGHLICEGDFESENVTFTADSPLAGKSRMEFLKRVKLNNCDFKDIITVKKRYHNAACRVFRGKIDIQNCNFINCSAFEIVRTKDSVVKASMFIKPVGTGLVIWHSYKISVKGNQFRGGSKTGINLKLNSADNCIIQENRFFDNGIGIELYGKSCKNKIIANSSFENNFGIMVHGNCSNNLILSCLIDSPGYSGIKILGGKKNIIKNCVVWSAAQFGIILTKRGRKKISTASVEITNSVIAKCKTGVLDQENMYSGKIGYNLLWENQKDVDISNKKFILENNLFKDPLFVSPLNDNFRPKMKAFGYKEDSPLIAAGCPEGTSIGLYPGTNKTE